MVVVDQRLIIQYCFERHIERAALSGITVHFAAFPCFKMAHPRAAANNFPVFRYLYSLLDAF